MSLLYFISHPEVNINPNQPITEWGLSEIGKKRTYRLLQQPWLTTISALFSSTEQKALETVAILGKHLNLSSTPIEDLGEIDRSSTGYLPCPEFDKVVTEFFASPDQSIRGWETAQTAQVRITTAIENCIQIARPSTNLAIISHGGVGALYLSYVLQKPISHKFDQPGNGGGQFFIVDLAQRKLVEFWQAIDLLK